MVDQKLPSVNFLLPGSPVMELQEFSTHLLHFKSTIFSSLLYSLAVSRTVPYIVGIQVRYFIHAPSFLWPCLGYTTQSK